MIFWTAFVITKKASNQPNITPHTLYLMFGKKKKKKRYKGEFCLTFIRIRGILHFAKVTILYFAQVKERLKNRHLGKLSLRFSHLTMFYPLETFENVSNCYLMLCHLFYMKKNDFCFIQFW